MPLRGSPFAADVCSLQTAAEPMLIAQWRSKGRSQRDRALPLDDGSPLDTSPLDSSPLDASSCNYVPDP